METSLLFGMLNKGFQYVMSLCMCSVYIQVLWTCEAVTIPVTIPTRDYTCTYSIVGIELIGSVTPYTDIGKYKSVVPVNQVIKNLSPQKEHVISSAHVTLPDW